MPATLRTLLADDSLHLRMLVTPDARVLDRAIAWAHSSDLVDPTPWLESGQLLLTDGTQLGPDADADALRAYCERMRDRDVTALGFATHVVHETVPERVVRACERAGLALVEVGEGTPFVSIVRSVADRLADDRTARLRWSLSAQRAIARAAVRPDGLGEILRTLAATLDVWVALFDASASQVAQPGLVAVPSSIEHELEHEVQRLLARGRQAASRIDGAEPASLQTIGQGGGLRGVLAVGTQAVDAAEHDLVVSVIALASVALEAQRSIDAMRRRVRSSVLALLVAGEVDAAADVSSTMWRSLPEPPLDVALVRVPAGGHAPVLDELELQAVASGGSMFYAERDQDVVVLASGASLRLVDPIVQRHGLVVGTARAQRATELGAAVDRARLAARAAGPGRPVRFETIADRGVLGLLRGSGGDLVARSTLAPLDALDVDERERLLTQARAWLAANGAWDPAARELGIHRHTLRTRMAHLGRLLGLDLDAFAGRAELWAALELAR